MKEFLLSLLICSLASCARLHHANEVSQVTLHKVDYGVEPSMDNGNWYHEFSCFNDHKSGRVFTTYASDMRKVLGLLYGMESTYNYEFVIYNDNFMLREKMEVASRPDSVSFEVAYCYYQDWRQRFTHFDDVKLLYMSVRIL